MSNSLKQYIKKRLKEKVPLGDIEYELIKKGYSPLTIGRVVRETLTHKNKIPIHTIQLTVLIVGVVIAIGVGVYFLGGQKTSENPEAIKGDIDIQRLKTNQTRLSPCNTYQNDLTYCQNAVTAALSRYPGEVANIIKESDSWKIDVLLFKPLMSREGEQKYNITVFTSFNGDEILRLTV